MARRRPIKKLEDWLDPLFYDFPDFLGTPTSLMAGVAKSSKEKGLGEGRLEILEHLKTKIVPEIETKVQEIADVSKQQGYAEGAKAATVKNIEVMKKGELSRGIFARHKDTGRPLGFIGTQTKLAELHALEGVKPGENITPTFLTKLSNALTGTTQTKFGSMIDVTGEPAVIGEYLVKNDKGDITKKIPALFTQIAGTDIKALEAQLDKLVPAKDAGDIAKEMLRELVMFSGAGPGLKLLAGPPPLTTPKTTPKTTPPTTPPSSPKTKKGKVLKGDLPEFDTTPPPLSKAERRAKRKAQRQQKKQEAAIKKSPTSKASTLRRAATELTAKGGITPTTTFADLTKALETGARGASARSQQSELTPEEIQARAEAKQKALDERNKELEAKKQAYRESKKKEKRDLSGK